MKEKLLSLTLILSCTLASAQNISYNWVATLESGSTQAVILNITNDNDDNVIVIGQFNDSLIYGTTILGGPTYLKRQFIAKYSSAGTLLWLNHYTSTRDSEIKGLATDSQNNIVVVGIHRGNIDFGDGSGVIQGSAAGISNNGRAGFILKISETGQTVWMKNYRNNNNYKEFIMDDVSIQDDKIYCIGRLNEGTVDVDLSANVSNLVFPSSSGHYRHFVVKLDDNGDFMWANGFESKADNGNTKARIVTTSDYTYIAGDFSHSTPGDSLTLTIGSPVIKIPPTAASNGNMFIAKLNNTNGQVTKVIGIGNSAIESIKDLKLDANGNVYLLGHSGYTLDVDPSAAIYQITLTNGDFIAKYSEDLNFISASQLEYGGMEIELDQSGEIYVGVSCMCTGVITGNGALVYRINQNYVYQNHYILNQGSYLYDLKLNGNKIYFGGGFSNPTDFDMSSNTAIFTPTIGSDAYVLSLTIDQTSAISETPLNNFSIFPNPTADNFTVSNLKIGATVKLLDVTGKIIYASSVTNTSIDLTTETFSSGIYFVQIIENNQLVGTKKLVVSK